MKSKSIPFILYVIGIISLLVINSLLAHNIVLTIAFIGWTAAAIWSYVDCKELVSVSNTEKKGFFTSSPIATAILVWLLGWVAFPLYVIQRNRVLSGYVVPEKASPAMLNVKIAIFSVVGLFVLLGIALIVSANLL